MRRLVVILCLLAAPALAQEIPGEFDTKLAIQGIAIGVQQLSRGVEVFAATCKQTTNLARYWQDACQSTPACGGAGDDKH